MKFKFTVIKKKSNFGNRNNNDVSYGRILKL